MGICLEGTWRVTAYVTIDPVTTDECDDCPDWSREHTLTFEPAAEDCFLFQAFIAACGTTFQVYLAIFESTGTVKMQVTVAVPGNVLAQWTLDLGAPEVACCEDRTLNRVITGAYPGDLFNFCIWPDTVDVRFKNPC